MPLDFFGSLNSQIAIITKDVYAGKKSGGVFQLIGELLTDTVEDSYGKIGVDYTTPDAAMLTRLTRDLWQFSAAKNYHEMRDITLALKDSTGKLREFAAFEEAVQGISEKYNKTWLRTEHNMAIGGSQNAARHTQFMGDVKDIPFWTYQTVGDSNVRDSHAALDGLTRRYDDPVWNTIYPMNGYGDRCEVIQAPGTTENRGAMPDNLNIPQLFRTNLAKTGLIFPKGHPYYEGIPKAEMRKAIAYLPPENTYLEVFLDDKKINIHPLHGDGELDENLNAVNTLLKHDKKAKIKLLPIIEQKDKAIKHKFYPKSYIEKYPLKNADISYNGKIAEIKTASGSKSSIQNRMKGAKKQSDFALIHLPDNTDMDAAFKVAQNHINFHYKDKEDLTVWIFNSNEKREIIIKQKGQ